MKTIDNILAEFIQTLANEWTTHPNGGGWVHKDAKVSGTAFVGLDAVIRCGEINGGEIHSGNIYRGNIYGGKIYGGTIYKVTIYGGKIYGGTMIGGEIHGGTINGGTMYGGNIYGGTINGGEIYDGNIRGGTINGGIWFRSPLVVLGSRDEFTNTKPGYIATECRCKPFAWWQSKEAEDFAKDEGYDNASLKEYKAIIQLMVTAGV